MVLFSKEVNEKLGANYKDYSGEDPLSRQQMKVALKKGLFSRNWRMKAGGWHRTRGRAVQAERWPMSKREKPYPP
jgi:hypothetical protein